MVELEVDLRNWDKRFDEYFRLTTRTADEVLNTKAFYIARNAVQETIAASKGQIRAEMNAVVASRSGKSASRAALIINAQQKKNGLKGLTGTFMNDAVEKLIKKRISTINFLRAGWIPAIRILKSKIDKNANGNASPGQEGMARGKPKGGAIPSKGKDLRSEVYIYNNVRDKTMPPRVVRLLTIGLQKAIDREVASMGEYIKQKFGEAANKTINKP